MSGMFRFLVLAACMIRVAGAAVVSLPETWPDASLRGWQGLDVSTGVPSELNLEVVDGALQLSPTVDPEATMDPRWSFIATTAASDGTFSGSFYGVGAHTLEFDFYTSVPVTLTVQWANESEFIFYSAVVATGSSGTTSRISVPLDPDHFSPDMFGSDEDFEALMRNTEQIWFTMDWDRDAASPVFRIDNVELFGAGEGYGTWIDGFAGQALRTRLPGTDADGDGGGNATEFIADTFPYDSSSFLSFYSLGASALGWNSSSNCNYAILRCTNLLEQAFVPVAILPGTGAAMEFEDADNVPHAFYKLNVGRK